MKLGDHIQRVVAVAAIAAALQGSIGCSLSYNGAWNMADSDKQQAAAYRKIIATQRKNVAPKQPSTPRAVEYSASAGKPMGMGQTGGPMVPDQSERGHISESTIATYKVNASAQSLDLLGKYGQFPRASASRSSPLDGVPNVRQITFSTEGGDFDPEVDPTGTLLVYASTRHRNTADIYLSRIGDSAITQLTSDPANEVMPAFSPDGKRIAFASDRAGNWDIYIMQATGGHAIQITNDLSHQIHASFSPDGKQLAYSSFGQQSGQWELVLVDVDNPTTKRFVGYGLFPDWSPVDNRIVFQRARERGTRWFSIWTLEIHDGEASQPTEVAASSNAAAITPCWGPDGKSIVFATVVDPDETSQSRTIESDVWITSASGQGRANLTNNSFSSLQPVWSTDGSILFVTDRAKQGIDNVWAIRPDRVLKLAQPVVPTAPSAMVKKKMSSATLGPPGLVLGKIPPMASTLPWVSGVPLQQPTTGALEAPNGRVSEPTWTIEGAVKMLDDDEGDTGAAMEPTR